MADAEICLRDETLREALLTLEQPSEHFLALRSSGALQAHDGELAALIGVPQPPQHHAEGDAFAHTLLVLDAAAKRRKGVEQPLLLMLSALCHDLGKAETTAYVHGALHAYGHEQAGLPLTARLLRRHGVSPAGIAAVQNLVELHMQPNILAAQGALVKATNRLFDRAYDADALLALALADAEGSRSQQPKPSTEGFLRERLAAYRAVMAGPYVTERDLIEGGVRRGEHVRDYLALAHKLRLGGMEKALALRQILGTARKNGDLSES